MSWFMVFAPGGGHKFFVRPVLRTLAWAGSLMALAGVYGLILTIRYYAGDTALIRATSTPAPTCSPTSAS